MYLASCSQDSLIRIWKIFAKPALEPVKNEHELKENNIKLKENVFLVKEEGKSAVKVSKIVFQKMIF